MSARIHRSWAVIDAACVLTFVAVGRRSHDEPGNVVVGALRVAAPFLIALVVGWLVARAWRQPVSAPTGAIIWIVTVAAGMVLRNAVFDRGTALSFVIVASVVLGLLLNGWRAIPRARQ
jgi:hypothetical protein